jgi:glutamate-1-semialdehyde 2,1-aminomutase
MAQLAPMGPVYQAGTLSGNPLAMAAGAAVLREVTRADYDRLSSTVARFATDVQAALTSAGLWAAVPTVGPLCGIYLSREPETVPRDAAGARTLCGNGLYAQLFHELLARGIALAPGAYEILFVSLAHSEQDLARTVDAIADAATAVGT